MKKEDLSALQNLYTGIFTEDSEPSVTDKPTTAKTITDGLGIYESHIKSAESPVPQKQVTLSEDLQVVTHITSSTPSTKPLKSASGILGNAQWGSVSTVNDISEIYSLMYEAKKEDQDKDGDNDFDDVRIARMIASGMSKEEAMRKIKEDPKGDDDKEEGIDEAMRPGPRQKAMREKTFQTIKKGGGKYKSTDRAIAHNVGVRGDVSPGDPDIKSRGGGGVKKDKGMGYGDRGAGNKARRRAGDEPMRGDTRKMKESKELNKEDTEYNNGSISEMAQEELIYNIVASYLLENSFAEDINDANSMMEAMSSAWVGTILEEYNEYVEDYNVFVENLEIAGYDLTEATDEDIEEAYKDVDKKKAVEKAANKEKASKNIEKFTKFRAKGIAQSNKLRGSITGGRSADRPAVKGDKETQEKGGYNPEKLNKDWYSRARPDSKMKRKGGEMETVSQRMDREHPYKNRMTGKMGREFGSRAAANVTDVLKALEGNRKKK